MNKVNNNLFPFRDKWIHLDGNQIRYIDEGKGDILLFCHPSIATSFMYRNLVLKLSPQYRCIALDFPGFGMSTARKGYEHSIQSQAHIVSELIHKLDLKDIFPVMQEIGGHAAIMALRAFPERVKGIIITDTIIFPVSEYPRITKMLDLINGKLFTLLNARFNLMIRGTYRFGIRNRKLSITERNAYNNAFDTKEKRRLVTSMLHQLKKEESLLRDVKHAFETTFNNTPALLIYGEKDPLFEMDIPQSILALLPVSELHIIKGEAHFPHEGAPDEMAEIIHQWITRLHGHLSES